MLQQRTLRRGAGSERCGGHVDDPARGRSGTGRPERSAGTLFRLARWLGGPHHWVRMGAPPLPSRIRASTVPSSTAPSDGGDEARGTAESKGPSFDSSPAIAQVSAYFEEHFTDLVALACRVRLGPVYGRDHYFSPDEYVSFAYLRIAAHLDASTDADDLAARLARCLQPSYLYVTMRHAALDLAKTLKSDQVTWDGEMPDAAVAEEWPADLRADVETCGALLQVLRERGERPEPPRTALTQRHLDCWTAMIRDGRGALTQLALRLGVDKGRVSQLITEAKSKVREALYLAGILAAPGTLGSPREIHGCLDVYDDRSARPALDRVQRAALETGANAVTISQTSGQRADHRRAAELHLKRRSHKALAKAISAGEHPFDAWAADFAQTLHAAESRHAEQIASQHPNCTLSCDRHNPVSDRVIWEVDLS